MFDQAGPGLIEVLEQLLLEETARSQHGVERHGGVSLAQDQPIAVWVQRLSGVYAQHCEVQGDQNVDTGESRAKVLGLGAVAHIDDLAAYLSGEVLEVRRRRRWIDVDPYGVQIAIP